MPGTSTPTTPTELSAALSTLNTVESADPWATQYQWPPILNQAPRGWLAVYDVSDARVTVYPGQPLTPEETANTSPYEVVVEATPGVFHRKNITEVNVEADTITIDVAGTTVDPGPAQVTYANEENELTTSPKGTPVNSFTIPVTTQA